MTVTVTQPPISGIEKSRAIAQQLRGHRLRIPDLRPLYARWAEGLNPEFDRLGVASMQHLLEAIPDKKHIGRAKALDAPFFTSTWFPETRWERLWILTMLCNWVFLWDDEIDDAADHIGPDSLAADINKGDSYRQASIAYIDYHLGLDPASSEPGPGPAPPTAVHGLMADICAAVRADCDHDVVVGFRDSLVLFIDGTAVEQRYRLAGYMPNMAEYWDLRIATSGTKMMCVLAQYSGHVELPKDIMASEPVEAIWREFTRNLILNNDLLSFKKEVKEETVISLIPVLLAQQPQSLDSIVDASVAELDDSGHCFDRACDDLRQLTVAAGYGEFVQRDVETYIKVFETMLTGCLFWSLKSKRYGMAELLSRDGSLTVDL